MPRCPSILDEEALFLQSVVSTDGRKHPLGVGDRDLYSNSGRTIPVRGPLMATVAVFPDIRTLTLRP
jgi:hypothetical protein